MRALTAAAAVLALLVLAGWTFDVGMLKSGLAGLGATQPCTALMLLACSAALCLSTFNSRIARVLAQTLVLAVLAFTALVLVQNALDADWGTDRLLFGDSIIAGQTGPFVRAGRPAGAALMGFLLFGGALLLGGARQRAGQRLFVTFATAGLLASISVVLAYALAVPALYVMGLYAQAGLVTGACFWLLFVALLVRRADVGWVRELTGDTPGALSTRHLLNWTVAVLVVVVGIVQFGTRASWYRAELEVVFVALAGVAILFAGLLSHARRIDALEREKRAALVRLHESRAKEAVATRALADEGLRRQELLNDIGHELRNPMAPLLNGMHVLRVATRDDADKSGTVAATVTMMERQLSLLTRAVDQLIHEYSHDGHKEPRNEPRNTPGSDARNELPRD